MYERVRLAVLSGGSRFISLARPMWQRVAAERCARFPERFEIAGRPGNPCPEVAGYLMLGGRPPIGSDP